MCRIIRFCGVTACAMILISCGGARIAFEMDHDDTYLKPGTIAVISGTNRDEDHMLAESISDNLRDETGFQVMSQKEIAEKIPDYFYKNIISEWEMKGSKFSFSPENMKAIKAVHKCLNTEYIYVVWSSDLVVIPSKPADVACTCLDIVVVLGLGNGTGGMVPYTKNAERSISRIYVYGRLMSFPDDDIIGYTADYFFNESCCITMPLKTYNYEITDLLKNTGRDIALEMKKYTKNKDIRKKRE